MTIGLPRHSSRRSYSVALPIVTRQALLDLVGGRLLSLS
jgi:hypothetical protein